MNVYIVNEGEVSDISMNEQLPDLSLAGREWVMFEAISEKDALHQAHLYDSRAHPRQKEIQSACEKVKGLKNSETAKEFMLNKMLPPDIRSIVICLESIGYNTIVTADNKPNRAWIAEIVGIHPKWKFTRKFKRGKRDFTHASRNASRGVYFYYVLQPGTIYEISNPLSNKNTDRYFCRIENEEEVRMNEQEVLMWLKEDSA
jgi:hypothetical protein